MKLSYWLQKPEGGLAFLKSIAIDSRGVNLHCIELQWSQWDMGYEKRDAYQEKDNKHLFRRKAKQTCWDLNAGMLVCGS